MTKARFWAVAPLLALALAGCGRGSETADAKDGPVAPSSQTLSAAIGDQSDLDTFEDLIKTAGLSEVLDGKGPYTVFAPANAALGAVSAGLSGDGAKAQSAALLRAHIVPGSLTRADILAAIARGGSDGVQVRTMADGLLTLTRDGETVVVTAPDGAVARLTGGENLVKNGVLQPVDALLVKPA